MKIKQPTIFIVGAGAVATALGGALRHAGVPVLGLWARRAHEARVAASLAGIAAYAAPPDRLLECDAVLFAVSDDAIAEVATRLVATGLLGPRHTLIHCSGARAASDAFAPVAAQVGGLATMHPLAAIAGGRAGISQVRGTSFGVEGNEHGVAVVEYLVTALRGTALHLSSSQMARYHLAASFGSNFLVTMVDQAMTLFVAAGLDEASARQAAVALASGTLANIKEKGTAAGLTGPIRRGDGSTIERHLKALDTFPEAKSLYLAAAAATLSLAERAGLAPADATRIAALLAKKP